MTKEIEICVCVAQMIAYTRMSSGSSGEKTGLKSCLDILLFLFKDYEVLFQYNSVSGLCNVYVYFWVWDKHICLVQRCNGQVLVAIC